MKREHGLGDDRAGISGLRWNRNGEALVARQNRNGNDESRLQRQFQVAA